MKTIEDIRNELAAIATELRAEDPEVASQLDTLNSTFYTTTTEYLVEAMGMIQSVRGQGTLRSSKLLDRFGAVERAARQLANLR